MIDKLTIDDIDVRGKRVFMRVDFNVPLTEEMEVADDGRIRAALPSIRKIITEGGKLVLASHLGRPKGVPKQEFSLLPVVRRLSDLLEQKVKLLPDSIGPEVVLYIELMKPGDVVLLENVRFHPGETKNDPEYAASLARLADVFVNDAFGTAHRSHASNVGVAQILQPAVAGYLIGKELRYLGKAVNAPKRPFFAVLGGAKISGKLDVIQNLLPKVDGIILGGAMTYTLFLARGEEVGDSLVEPERLEMAKELLALFDTSKTEVLLPVDSIVADAFAENASTQVVRGTSVPAGWRGMDIGPESIKLFADRLKTAGTIVWNGPMGVFEMEPFQKGTHGIAEAMVKATAEGAVTIVGGGDSASALRKFGLEEKVTHVSTGGGASLEFLEGKELPGIAVLTDRY